MAKKKGAALQGPLQAPLHPPGARGPLRMLFDVLFFFAKLQYDELQRERLIISQEEAELVDLSLEEQNVVGFLQNFVNNKLELLKQLSGSFQENRQAMLGQIMLLQIEIEKLLSRVNKESKN